MVYCEGLGQTTNAASVSGVSGGGQIAGGLKVNIGTKDATRIDYKGISPGFVGLYQVNVPVPDGSPSGSAIPIIIRIGGATSNTVTIAVQ